MNKIKENKKRQWNLFAKIKINEISVDEFLFDFFFGLDFVS